MKDASIESNADNLCLSEISFGKGFNIEQPESNVVKKVMNEIILILEYYLILADDGIGSN